MKNLFIKKYIGLFIGITVSLLAFIYFFVTKHEAEEMNQTTLELQTMMEETNDSNKESSEDSNKRNEMFVDVKGEVVHPGLYKVNENERVYDVINKAGGFTKNADKNKVNLAQILQDEMVLYIPKIGEEDLESVPQAEGQEKMKKLNLNLATQEELETLPGIGPSKAAAIINYRNEQGKFKVIEDLMNVAGIGKSTFENVKEHIDVK